jgi:hypothetical protein
VEKQAGLDRVDEASVFGMFYAIDFDDVMLNSRHITHGTVPRSNAQSILSDSGEYWSIFGTIELGIIGVIALPVASCRLTSISRQRRHNRHQITCNHLASLDSFAGI